MKARMSWIRSQAARALLAKLVMVSSVFIALADSAPPEPPTWYAEDQGQVQLAFTEQNERTLILSIELDGALYADARVGEVEVLATADRTASDLELSVRPFEPDPDESAQGESASEAETDFRAGFAPDSGVSTARASVKNPNLVSLSVPVECADYDAELPRAESCLEQVEITLTRESQRPLSVDLTVVVRIYGGAETQPEGTFQIHLEELAP